MDNSYPTSKIIDQRPPKNPISPWEPYHYLHEKETDTEGNRYDVNTIFLSNSECPWKCLMCDLWKNTLDKPTPKGAIPQQIKKALSNLPEASVVKLYNSGNFFDKKAIPETDYKHIAKLLDSFNRVVVENHPLLCNYRCAEFNQMLSGTLEIALGLETIHPEILPRLNKKITLEDYKRAVSYLKNNQIDVRTFLLLNPPFLQGRDKNIKWTLKSLEYAFSCGSDRCTIIPVRGGNGIMDELKQKGNFLEPELNTLEVVFSKALEKNSGHVEVDTWDLERFSTCLFCFEERKKRLEKMNVSQSILPEITCRHCS